MPRRNHRVMDLRFGFGCGAPCIGISILGSHNVRTNRKMQMRLLDLEIAFCVCGPHPGIMITGSDTVYANRRKVHRLFDLAFNFCPGIDWAITASPNVDSGG